MNKFKIIINTFIYRLRIRKKNVKISILAFLDNNCELTENIKIDRLCVFHKVFIDRFTYIGFNTHINSCKIGKFCSISSDVKIGLGKHPTQMVSLSPIFYSLKNPFSLIWLNGNTSFEEYEEVVIGNDVWIGTNVIIMGGVKIGDGAIIGAGSIVTKDVEPFTIVAGNPATMIRKRFDENTINKLLKICWWDWDDECLKNKAQYFIDIKRFL